jgi:hypothetical protein
MKGLIIYRILTVLVNTISFLLALSLLTGLTVIFSQPAFAIPFFMMLCIVLYAWFSNVFLKKVLLKKETVTKKTKDLIQVNAIVSFILCCLIIVSGSMLLSDPKPYFDALSEMTQGKTTDQMAITQLWVFIFVFFALAIHIVWTYFLIRKNAAYFKD